MPGRKLRRQREAATTALTDDQATDLASKIVPRLRRSELAVLQLMQREQPSTHPHAAVAVAVATNPQLARVVVAMRQTDPDIESALGITRSTSQQLH